MGVPIPEVAHYRSAGGSRTMKRQFTGYISPGKPLAGNNRYLSPGKPLVGNDLTVVAHSRNPYGQSYYEQMYQTTELSRASSSSHSNAKGGPAGSHRVTHRPGTKPQMQHDLRHDPWIDHRTKRSADRRADYRSMRDLATALVLRPFAGTTSIPGRETSHF